MQDFAANLTMLFTELPFEQRFSASAEAGFAAVEFLFPYAHASRDVAAWARDAGVTIAMFNLPPGDWGASERGIAALPDRCEDFRSTLDLALSYAEVLGVSRLHVMSGRGAGAEQAVYVENLGLACVAAPAIEFLVEPISSAGIPDYLVQSPAQALGIIDDVAMPNCKLQFDLFHAAMVGEDAVALIEANIDRIGHVQIAGAPGRNEPDIGSVDHSPALRALQRLGYAGWVGAEYHPLGRTEDGLGWRERLA